MYRLNEEQQRIVADAAAVADATIAPQAARVDRGRGISRSSRSPRSAKADSSG